MSEDFKVYAGNLSFNTTQDALEQAFAEFGQITHIKLITDRETGRSKGFGFISFADKDAADAAVNGLNGQDLDGRQIRVSEAKNDGGAPRRSGGGGGYRG